MHTMTRSSLPLAGNIHQQEPFKTTAPLLTAALLLGAGGGFMFATVLTLTRALNMPLGPWWSALAQAHGHIQLYGWAGLFVLGVAFHFLPRLRGAPLAWPRLVPWLLSLLVAGLLLRALSQPLLAIMALGSWRILLIASGVLECIALLGCMVLFGQTARMGPPLASRQAFRGIMPFVITSFVALGVASIVNLVNVVEAASGVGLVLSNGDDLNVMLGLLGFLVPMALAMSARALPMYAGLEAFPRRVLWPLAGAYLAGLALAGASTLVPEGADADVLKGLGLVLLGCVILVFVGLFMRLGSMRGRLPKYVARLAPKPESAAQAYRTQVATERETYGPYVILIMSAYLWAMLGAVLLVVNGVTLLSGMGMIITPDAIRHSFALGFIALLICGIAPRMLPGFSGGRIMSPRLVSATLWLGNSAALLRVGSLLFSPLLVTLGSGGRLIDTLAFGLSGPVGLALAICLAVNLWPALNVSWSDTSKN